MHLGQRSDHCSQPRPCPELPLKSTWLPKYFVKQPPRIKQLSINYSRFNFVPKSGRHPMERAAVLVNMGSDLLFAVDELCLNLGDAHHQAARFSVSFACSTPPLLSSPFGAEQWRTRFQSGSRCADVNDAGRQPNPRVAWHRHIRSLTL